MNPQIQEKIQEWLKIARESKDPYAAHVFYGPHEPTGLSRVITSKEAGRQFMAELAFITQMAS